MCGRYWIDSEPEGELAEIIACMQRLELPDGRSPAKLSGEIFPGDSVPVICRSRNGKIMSYPMEWGFHSADGRRIINARSETAREKPMFRQSMTDRRCLVPMSAYFEWQTRGREKIRHRIIPEESGLCCLAGLYRFEGDRPVFTVLTRDAAPEISFIHDRMPVILPYADREEWLSGCDMDAPSALHMHSDEMDDGPRQLMLEI